MIRLTVLYNLPPETDEDEFVEWRLSQHQLAQGGIPGVISSSFHRVVERPGGDPPRYRFMTIADWADRESFERGFYSEPVQEKLRKDVESIRDAVFLVSEELSPDPGSGTDIG